MPRFFFNLSGSKADDTGTCFENVHQARNAAVTFLGEYLADHPEFAFQGHWQVDVASEEGKVLLHVIVATVDGPATREPVPAREHSS